MDWCQRLSPVQGSQAAKQMSRLRGDELFIKVLVMEGRKARPGEHWVNKILEAPSGPMSCILTLEN